MCWNLIRFGQKRCRIAERASLIAEGQVVLLCVGANVVQLFDFEHAHNWTNLL